MGAPNLSPEQFHAHLAEFASQYGNSTKGSICAACVIGSIAKSEGMTWPLIADKFLTGGQIRGMGGSAIREILKPYGLPPERLPAEGGRTSRGTVDFLKRYLTFLNGLSLPESVEAVFGHAEAFWAEQMRAQLAKNPLTFSLDSGKGLRVAVRRLIQMARERGSDGSNVHGTVLQHLVGAKLELVLGEKAAELGLSHNSANTKDGDLGRLGDFKVGDTVFHITTNPSYQLLEKCKANVDAGLRPLIVTLGENASKVDVHAETLGILDRVEAVDVEQFLTTNVYEMALFKAEGIRPTLERLVAIYNRIVAENERDPSLAISLA